MICNERLMQKNCNMNSLDSHEDPRKVFNI